MKVMSEYITVYGVATTDRKLYLSKDFWIPITQERSNTIGWWLLEKEIDRWDRVKYRFKRGIQLYFLPKSRVLDAIDSLQIKWMYSQEQNKQIFYRVS